MIGDSRALRPLERALEDDNEFVREAAMAAPEML